MSIEVKVNGITATNPLEFLTAKGNLFTKFRLASTPRYKINGEWKNGKTQWFTIKAWERMLKIYYRQLKVIKY